MVLQLAGRRPNWLLFCLLVLLVSTAALAGAWLEAGNRPVRLGLASLAALFFAAVTVRAANAWLHHAPCLALGRRGIRVRDNVASRLIPWAEVVAVKRPDDPERPTLAVSIVRTSGQPLAFLRNQIAATDPQIAAWLGRANAMICGGV